MRTFIGICVDGSFTGNWYSCITWGSKQIRNDSETVVKIYQARPGGKEAKTVAEFTTDRLRIIVNGRRVLLRRLKARYG